MARPGLAMTPAALRFIAFFAFLALAGRAPRRAVRQRVSGLQRTSRMLHSEHFGASANNGAGNPRLLNLRFVIARRGGSGARLAVAVGLPLTI